MRRTFLERSTSIYEAFAERIPDPHDLARAETTLGFVEGLANVALYAHPGRYADGKVENVLLEIGQRLESLESPAWAKHWEPPALPIHEQRQLLHVATEIYAVGGHTRLLKNWIQNDPTSSHSVVLTRQPASFAAPAWFLDPIAKSGGRLIVMPPDGPRVRKAKWLREIARGVDAVILHHHPDDVLPTVAFATTGLPPVAVLNHADHVFWLGSAVSDMVINIRPAGKLLSEARRMAGLNELLPIPLETRPSACTRSAARGRLQIDDDEVM